MKNLFPLPEPILAATSTGAFFPVRRVFCVGRNYAAHAREMGGDPSREPPFFFTAWAETVVPGGGTIPYPSGTANYHYEAELVIAIGTAGRNIPPERAHDHIWGYAAGLDMTRRDLQSEARASGRPWDTSKNIEYGSPLGLIRKSDDDFNSGAGVIQLTVNGEVRQVADLADMIWPAADIVSFLSGLYRLEPGDLIYTGTPDGVGPVVEGDRIVVTIDGLSSLTVCIGPPAD